MTERKHLTKKRKAELFFAAGGRCGICREKILGRTEWDHIQALVFNGTNEADNWQPLHPECHRPKSTGEHKANSKAKRITKAQEDHIQKLAAKYCAWVVEQPKPKPYSHRKMQGSGFRKDVRKKMNGTVVRREQAA